jgi:hypothetical protein
MQPASACQICVARETSPPFLLAQIVSVQPERFTGAPASGVIVISR